MSTQSYIGSQDESVIRHTTDYNLFKFDPRNRPIDHDRVCSLYDAIAEKNLLHDYPIVVDKELTVLDGQHRLRAAEGLGVPIYYIVSQKATIEDIARVSHDVKNWSGEDYLHHWCARGISDYLRLKEFRAHYPFVTLSVAIKLCHFGDYKACNRDFVAGRYRLNDLGFGLRVVNSLLDFKRVGFSGYNHTAFVVAVSNLLANSDYSHEIMRSKLEYLSTKLVRCADADSYIAMLNEIYNYRARENRVDLKRISSGNRRYRTDRIHHPA